MIRFWRSRFNASPDVLGKKLRINGGSWSVVDTTYFWLLLSTAVKGLGSGRLGQTE